MFFTTTSHSYPRLSKTCCDLSLLILLIKHPVILFKRGIIRKCKKPHVITGKKLFASEDEVKFVYAAKLELYAAARGFTLSPMVKCLQSCCEAPPLVNE